MSKIERRLCVTQICLVYCLLQPADHLLRLCLAYTRAPRLGGSGGLLQSKDMPLTSSGYTTKIEHKIKDT